MANNTYTGAAGGAWATGGNWSAGHKPTSLESAIINANVPAAPLVDETAQDLTYSAAGSLNASAHLTISTNITHSSGDLQIKAQTGSGGAVALTSTGTFTCAGTVAGTVTLGDAIIGGGTFTGAVTTTFSSAVIVGTINGGTLTIPSGLALNGGDSTVSFTNSARVVFTGTSTVAWITGGSLISITSAGDLAIIPLVSAIDLTGATVTCAGNLMVAAPPVSSFGITVPNITATGNNTGKQLIASNIDTTLWTITGFGPSYKIGAGAVLSATIGTRLDLPDQSTVQQGTTYGPSDGLTGTLPTIGGQHGMGLGI